MEEIVIGGISGRFPKSENIEEFWKNLNNGVDMVTVDNVRWPIGQNGLPNRKGTLSSSLEEFDAELFGINRLQVNRLDPNIRQLLEVTYECILDSGYNPIELKGRNIGVYVGSSSHESLEAGREEPSRYDITGSSGCMVSNRISFAFDFKGPSLTVDTYCSSSLMALHLAVSAIRSGEIAGAIVGGVNLLLNPLLSVQLQQLGVLSQDGKCKAFDESGNGYVRSEGIVAIYLTKASYARRTYGSILHSKSNADGYKENGVSFPSGIQQEDLTRQIYSEAHIDPNDVFYVEAHGTGTSAGDPQELNAIASVFCTNRSTPLLIGSTKSNMGHAEGAASLCGVIKVLMALQKGVIPGNLHFRNPNPHIPGLKDGRLEVVTKNTPITGDLFGINASGIGGSNIHIILRAPKLNTVSIHPKYSNMSLVPFSGRTHAGVMRSLANIGNERDESRDTLLRQIHEKDIEKHDFRGFDLIHKNDNTHEISIISDDELSKFSPNRPLWYIFPGMGTQWPGMGKDLLQNDITRKSLETSAEIVKKLGIDLIYLLVDGTEDEMKKYMSLCFVTVGMAIIDFLNALNLNPNGLIGHSAGEFLCAYADKCISREECLLSLYWKDILIQELDGSGGMASVGLTWDQAKEQCPTGVYPACHNAENNVTVTGPSIQIQKLVTKLKLEGIFAKEVSTGGVAYHSPYLKGVALKFKQKLEEIIKNPQNISSKWLSTSISSHDESKRELGKSFSPEHIVNNFLSPVLFYDAIKQIPQNAICIEVGSHCLFQNIVKRTLSQSCTVLPTMKKGENDNVRRIYEAVGLLFQYGLQPKFINIHPYITTTGSNNIPLTSLVSISPLIDFNHKEKFPLLNYIKTKSKAGDQLVKISLDDDKYKYLEGHKIDNRILFPATGYLALVWETFADLLGKPFNVLNVEFEDVRFLQATILTKGVTVELQISIFLCTGEFRVSDRGNVVVTGKIQCTDEEIHHTIHKDDAYLNEVVLNSSDVYKDFRLRGYEYTGEFQGILKTTTNGDYGKVLCNRNWIPFLDTILQLSLVSLHQTNGLYLPTGFKRVVLNPMNYSNRTKKESISVAYSSTTKSISTNGILIQGLKFSSTTRRHTIPQETLLQTWTFIPYIDSDSVEWEFDNALKICIDIVLENTSSNGICIEEIMNQEGKSESLLPKIQRIVECSPGRMVLKSREEQLNNLLLIQSTLCDRKVNSDFLLFVTTKENITSKENYCITDYNLVASKRSDIKSFFLFKKKKGFDQAHPEIEISNTKYSWLEEFQKFILSSNLPSRIWLIGSEPDSGIIGLVNCIRKEPNGELIRSIFSTIPPIQLEKYKELDLVMNVIDSQGIHGSYRSLSYNPESSKLCRSPSAYLNVVTIGDLSSVAWIQSPRMKGENISDVYYAPLNFRDVMLGIGKLSPDSLPNNLGKKDCILGLEWVGKDARGVRIMGAVESMSLATHVVVSDRSFMWEIPDSWSMAEAATIPIAYSTAYYALVVRGCIKPGEKVFVTSGSGGVGQAAISIALSLNCQVFTTVGSEEKKKFLLDHFPKIVESHILNSRSTEFEFEIQRLTKGQGVDLVLNSLSESKLQAATRVLAIGGRFLEIGKFDLSQNKELGMEIFLRNISFHGILLDALFGDDPTAVTDRSLVIKLVKDGIESGVVRPLPYTLFGYEEAEAAFRYMASGKHIGKVIIEIRKECSTNSVEIPSICRSYFNPIKIYILIGGLGGFGLEFVNWMLRRGGRRFVFITRSGVTSGYQSLQIKRWEQDYDGLKIYIHMKELVTVEDVEELLQEYKNYGEIGGIFNLAMVLKDGLIENQTPENFLEVMKPKYNLTNILDKASRRLKLSSLDYFVVFSSVSSVCGNIGQSNYGLANSSMERICEKRRLDNLPGIAIAWGAIGDVGVIQEKYKNNSTIAGTIPQGLHSCLDILDKILHPSTLEYKSNSIISSFVLPTTSTRDTIQDTPNQELSLVGSIAKILGVSMNEIETKKGKTLAELGLDSLMTAEVKQLLERNGLNRISNSEIRNLKLEKLLK